MIVQVDAKPKRVPHNKKPDPTAAEIRKACEQIRATWGPAEWASRRVNKSTGWTVPVCTIEGDVDKAAN